MSSIAVEFADVLSTVSRPSAFCVGGTEQILAPGLAVEGVGPIALPLVPVQAEHLIAAAERAPYGRGEDTLTDVTVRRTWQIGPDRVRIAGKHWPQTIQAIVARVAEGLGVADPIEAELYKLLVYDKGSFFVPHRDTEKVAGMFATLVLALPSASEGGDLIVRHKDREMRLDLRCEEPSDIAFAAFYADCVHEVLPVTAGYRLVLVYNLVRHGPGRLPEVPDYADEQETLTTLLQQWVEAPRSEAPEPEDAEPEDEEYEPDEGEPEKLIYLLAHAYTPAELSFQALKGADAAIAPVVVAAAQRASCDVHLALITIEENGSAQYNGDYRRPRRGRYRDDDDDEEAGDEDDFEVIEIVNQDAVASHWRRPDGQPSPLTDIPVQEAEFSPPMSFEELEPDEQHFHEATGNEGASFERTYRRAALILWPTARLLAVINQAGLGVTLPFLADLLDRWTQGGDGAMRDQAQALSREMLSDWPRGDWSTRGNDERSDTGRFLRQLIRLNDEAKLEAFLDVLAGRHGFSTGDCADIADALQALPPDRAADLARRLIDGAAEPTLAACATLLELMSVRDRAVAIGAARTLVASLPGDLPPAAVDFSWRRGPGVRPGFIVDLFTALGRIDATLAAVAADHVLEWPRRYDFDTALVPAVRILLDRSETSGPAAVQRLRAACLAHLDTRIALPLEAPSDWRRDDKLGCNCKDCQALGLFLDDAAQPAWVFAAAEPRRRHVEATIRAAGCDVDTATEKRGSPHRLICTKNQASYQRRCAQRANDLTERERLSGS
jgi:predicted 2-oxoglutarate/Fe(II)-dependent dioxygenase YbiX